MSIPQALPSRPDIEMSGKIVIVTGGASGTGAGIVQGFLDAGAKVAICDRPEMAEKANGQARFFPCDLRSHGSITGAVDGIASEFRRIDVLVTAAGGSPNVDFATVSPRFHEGVLALNLHGPIHFAQAVHRHMIANDEGGAIVNLTSIAALRPAPQTSCYAAARAGILGLTKSLAMEWAPHIRVNAIVAGMVDWGDDALPYGSADARRAICEALPGKRMGAPADVAMAALYLASPMASYISGTTMELHGGGEPPLFLDIIKRHSAIRA